MSTNGKFHIRIYAGLFFLALIIRLIYLYDSSDNPTFYFPLIDSRAYNDEAQLLVSDGIMSSHFFNHSIFYPFFLSIIYFFSHSSIVAAKVVQAVVGAGTCLLACRLGERIFNLKTGIFAALILVFYGPLIFFEGELLATGWAAFWPMVMLLTLLNNREKTNLRSLFILGLCGACNIISRPTIIPFLAASAVWLIFACYRDGKIRRLIIGLPAALAGFLLIVAPVAIQGHRITGHTSILPSNGPLNLYIGNNPDMCETLTARPGPDYERLRTLPQLQNISDWKGQKRYYYQLVWDYVSTQPLDFCKGIASKTAQFFCSREIPNTINMYLFRPWSNTLRVLVWKAGGFGFPFGILFPLALIGLICRWRQLPWPFILLVILYPLAVILIHANDRYRIPVIPPMAILAAAGCFAFISMIQARKWTHFMLTCLSSAVFAVAISLPGPFCLEEIHYKAELHYGLGGYYQHRFQRIKPEQAVEQFNMAIELKPDYADAHAALGRLYLAMKKPNQALSSLLQAKKFRPDEPDIYLSISNAYSMQNRFYEATNYCMLALKQRPHYPMAHNNLGWIYYIQKKYDEAVEQYEQALEHVPNIHEIRDRNERRDLAQIYNNFGIVLIARKEPDRAVEQLLKALELDPAHAIAHSNLANAYYEQGKINLAHQEADTALKLNPYIPMAYLTRGKSLAHQGKFYEAITCFRKVLEINPNHRQARNWLNAAHQKKIWKD